MRIALTFAALALAGTGTAALVAQPAKPPLDGKALFDSKCAMCHGPIGMGTGLLARRVQPAELEKRTNLTRIFVVAAARSGIGNMPPIPRGEASDAELNAIGDYLASRRTPNP